MECVMMRRKGSQFVALEVPGLAERRPSLVHGDFIFAKIASDYSDGSVYQVCYFFQEKTSHPLKHLIILDFLTPLEKNFCDAYWNSVGDAPLMTIFEKIIKGIGSRLL